jgi:hypothetical protein
MNDFNFSLGASGKKKPIKKEINVNVGWFHIFLFFIYLVMLVIIVIKVLIFFGVGVDSMAFTCTNGSIESVAYNKTIYCGESYLDLKDVLSESKFNNMEDIIWNKTK